jgi:hypothetical protein
MPAILGASIPQSGQAEHVTNHTEQILLQECAQAWLKLALTAPGYFMEELERSVWLSAFRPPLADDNAAAAAALKTLHSYREPEYRTIKPSLSARKLPAPEAELKFQKHQFNNIKRKSRGKNRYDPDDFENIQEQFLAYGQHSPTSGMVLAKTTLAAKQGMEEQPEIKTKGPMFAGIPRLEISTEPILLRRGLRILVSMPPPNIVKAPTWKCKHGVTKARDGYAYSCSQCFEKVVPTKTRAPKRPIGPMAADLALRIVTRYRDIPQKPIVPNWADKLEIEESIETCELCGAKLQSWQKHYCADCWKVVMFSLNKVGKKFTQEFYTQGASSKYQEKKKHNPKWSDNLPTWAEVLTYLRQMTSEAYGPDSMLDIEDFCSTEWLRCHARCVPGFKTFCTRWWMVTHGCSKAEIEGWENKQVDHWFAETGAEIRRVLGIGQVV